MNQFTPYFIKIYSSSSQTPYSKTKTETESMSQIFVEGVKACSSVTLEPLLTIPRIMTNSNERFCSVVQVSYEIKVEAQVSGCHANVEIKIPITIGSVPFTDDLPFTQVPQIEMSSPSAPLLPPVSVPVPDLRKSNIF